MLQTAIEKLLVARQCEGYERRGMISFVFDTDRQFVLILKSYHPQPGASCISKYSDLFLLCVCLADDMQVARLGSFFVLYLD